MKPYIKAYSITFALILLFSSIAYGTGDNPFVEEEKSKAAVLPAGKGGLKGPSGGLRPESLNEVLPFAQSPAPQPQARTERKWKIKGKVNDMVVISDEKGERIHVKNGEVFDGCLIQFPSAVCDRDAVIKTLQETVEREKKERIVLSKEALSLRTALEQKEKEKADLSRTIDDFTQKNSGAESALQQLRKEHEILAREHKEAQAAHEKSLKGIEDLVFQKGDMETALEQLRKEHEGVLVQIKEMQAAQQQSLREVDTLKAGIQEKEAQAAKATAEAVKHKTASRSLLEMAALREQCSTEMGQLRTTLKERETEALGAGVLIEYVQKSGERVPTEEYGEIIVKEMNDSLIIGVSREHADQSERSLAKAAKAKIMQERFIFYLLKKGSIEFALPSPGEAVKAVQGQRVAG